MPTSKVLFISTQYLRDNTPINGNVDSELIEPFIIQAQNVNIERVIGTGLFNDIKTNITNNTVSGLTKTLLDDFIQPALKEWVVYHSLPFLNYKFTNKAVSKKSSDNSKPSDLAEIQYLRGSVRDIAEYMSTRLTDYLTEQSNKGNFPLYRNPGNTLDTIRPVRRNYFNGLYTGRGGQDCTFGEGSVNIPLN